MKTECIFYRIRVGGVGVWPSFAQV